MSAGEPGANQDTFELDRMNILRQRIIVLIVTSVVVIALLLLALQIYHEQKQLGGPSSRPTDTQKTQLREQVSIQIRTTLLTIGVAFTGLLLLYAFLRWSRHYRDSLTRSQPPPTSADDVWSMHKVPPDKGDSDDNEGL